jgi:hypothetical protein
LRSWLSSLVWWGKGKHPDFLNTRLRLKEAVSGG